MPFRACSHYPERFGDQCKAKKGEEYDVELFKAREDSAEALEPTEESFNLVAFLVEGAIIVLGEHSVGLGRNHGNHPQIQH